MPIEIYIPTKGRAKQQETVKWIPEEYKHTTFLVCPEEEYQEYANHNPGVNILPTPAKICGIAATRQWIIDGATRGKLIMMDDDQHFQKRIPDKWNLKACTPDEMVQLLQWMEALLEQHPMVGLSARQGNNRSFPEKIVYNVRTFNTYAIDVDKLREHNIKFNELPLMEDFNVVLKLLRLGYNIPNIQEFCWGQDTSNAEGGCSTYRTSALQEESARMLESLHPDFVKVVTRKAKSWAGGLDSRIDVRVSWKAAYQSSLPESERPKKETTPRVKKEKVIKEEKRMTEEEKQILKKIAQVQSKLSQAAKLLTIGEEYQDSLSDALDILEDMNMELC